MPVTDTGKREPGHEVGYLEADSEPPLAGHLPKYLNLPPVERFDVVVRATRWARVHRSDVTSDGRKVKEREEHKSDVKGQSGQGRMGKDKGGKGSGERVAEWRRGKGKWTGVGHGAPAMKDEGGRMKEKVEGENGK